MAGKFKITNAMLILRDIGEIILSWLTASSHRISVKPLDSHEGADRFDVLDIMAPSNTRSPKTEDTDSTKPSEETATEEGKQGEEKATKIDFTEDYNKRAQKQHREDEEKKAKAAEERRRAEQEESKKRNDEEERRKKEQEIMLRNRARSLRSEISFWESERGRGQYTDDIVESTISRLQNELNGIPSCYWN